MTQFTLCNNRILRRKCMFEALIKGKYIDLEAYIVDKPGMDEEKGEVEMLFGALMTQKWGIRPIPDEEKLDLSHYPKEFIEF